MELQVSLKLTYSSHMHKGKYLNTLLRSPKSILTLSDAALAWRDDNATATKTRLSYYAKQGELLRLRRGFYSKDRNYDRLELATRLYTPSYISFETVLLREGVIFQYHSNITVASYLSREVVIDGQKYSYTKIKAALLSNEAGIEHLGEVSIASKERAFLDLVYKYGDFYCDNLEALDFDKIFALLPHYHNQRMVRTIDKTYATRSR